VTHAEEILGRGVQVDDAERVIQEDDAGREIFDDDAGPLGIRPAGTDQGGLITEVCCT